MPIRPENKERYPKGWKEISRAIRFDRAQNRCEECGAINYSYVNRISRELCTPDEDGAIQIVLTVAHLDHTPENCEPENLKALCQKCHNRYDRPHRNGTIKARKMKGQMSLKF